MAFWLRKLEDGSLPPRQLNELMEVRHECHHLVYNVLVEILINLHNQHHLVNDLLTLSPCDYGACVFWYRKNLYCYIRFVGHAEGLQIQVHKIDGPVSGDHILDVIDVKSTEECERILVDYLKDDTNKDEKTVEVK